MQSFVLNLKEIFFFFFLSDSFLQTNSQTRVHEVQLLFKEELASEALVLNYKNEPIPQRLFFSKKTHKHSQYVTWPFIWEEHSAVVRPPIFIQGYNLEILSFFSLCLRQILLQLYGELPWRVREKPYWRCKRKSSCSRLSSLHLSATLIKLKEWLSWPHMPGTANKWAQQLGIITAVLLWSGALPDSFSNLCTSSPDTLLAEQADGGFECEGWTEQLWVSAAG